MKISKRTATRLSLIGDTVYILHGNKICPATVTAICDDCLETDKDLLFYDEHATFWFLTREMAVAAITEKG